MITAIYTALLAVLLIVLSVNTIKSRQRNHVALGDSEHYDLQKRVRAHANFTEYAPLFLILLGSLEHLGLSIYILHGLGLLFLVARLSHAYGLTIAERFDEDKLLNRQYRAFGMAGTFISLGTGATLVFILVLMRTLF